MDQGISNIIEVKFWGCIVGKKKKLFYLNILSCFLSNWRINKRGRKNVLEFKRGISEKFNCYNYNERWLYCFVPLHMLIVEMVMMMVDWRVEFKRSVDLYLWILDMFKDTRSISFRNNLIQPIYLLNSSNSNSQIFNLESFSLCCSRFGREASRPMPNGGYWNIFF